MTDIEVSDSANAAIDNALAPLATLSELPVEEHPAIFDAVHAQLRSTMTNPQDPQ